MNEILEVDFTMSDPSNLDSIHIEGVGREGTYADEKGSEFIGSDIDKDGVIYSRSTYKPANIA